MQATQGACEHGDESLLYVDTHAGAGMYQLQAREALSCTSRTSQIVFLVPLCIQIGSTIPIEGSPCRQH